MDDFVMEYGNIAVVPASLRKGKSRKTELEKVPKPHRTISLKEWCDEKQVQVQEQKKQMARS